MTAPDLSNQIIESVPNFSEGRRREVIEAIVAAIQAPGVLLLDQSSDWDHNRSVVTVAGSPAAVLEGLFRAVTVAAGCINLFEHRGQHPRLNDRRRAARPHPQHHVGGMRRSCRPTWRAHRRVGTTRLSLREAAMNLPERRNPGRRAQGRVRVARTGDRPAGAQTRLRPHGARRPGKSGDRRRSPVPHRLQLLSAQRRRSDRQRHLPSASASVAAGCPA